MYNHALIEKINNKITGKNPETEYTIIKLKKLVKFLNIYIFLIPAYLGCFGYLLAMAVDDNVNHLTFSNRIGVYRKLHFCAVCGKAYSRKIELDMHQFCHSVPLAAPENLLRGNLGDLMTQCPCCFKAFCRRQDLMCHMDNGDRCVKIESESSIAINHQKQRMGQSSGKVKRYMSKPREDRHVKYNDRSRRFGELITTQYYGPVTKFERQCAIVQRFLDAEKSSSISKVNCVKGRYSRRTEATKMDGSNLLSNQKKDINSNDANFTAHAGMSN